MRNEYYISVLLAILGLAGMTWASVYVEPTDAKVKEIKPSWTGRIVEIDGNASQYGNSSGTVFFQLRDSTGSIDVVKFNSGLEELHGPVTVEGEVGIYKGEMQIVADEVVQR